jgi:regulatory protein
LNEPKKNPALTRALNLLSKRSYSEKRIREKLSEDFRSATRKSNLDPSDIDAAIKRLLELSFLDDKRFADSLSREMAEFRHFGPRRIYMELIKKGIPKDLAKETTDNIEHSFDESLDEVLKKYLKKCKNVPREKVYNRALGFMIRRGFSYDQAKNALQANLKH